jgi:predicted PurR-regulated permease PerM
MPIPLAKLTQVLLLFFLIILGLYYGKSFLVPIAFAILFALLLVPLCNAFERWDIKRQYASLLCIILVLLPLALGVILAGHQLATFTHIWSPIHAKVVSTLDTVQHFVEKVFGTSIEKQIEHIRFELSSFIKLAEISVSRAFGALAKVGALLLLILVYTFFFLKYRLKFQTFVLSIAAHEKHKEIIDTIRQVQDMTSHYLLGMLIVTVVLAILNSVGLFLLGVPHPLLLGIVAAILTLIPYVGSMVGAIIPLIVKLSSGGSWQTLVGIIVFFIAVQLFDNHVLKPTVIGFHIKINPLAIIMFALLGGLLWGIVGLILFIPLVGILKIIFEHIPQLRPYAYLLSSES